MVSSGGPSGTHSEAKVRGPGVVTGRYGTLGQVFFVEGPFWPLNTTLYVCDFKGNDPRFISYFLRTIDYLAYSDKAAVPGVNRNHLHEARVRWPNVETQREVASVLGALDDKIELNRRMSETLEGMTRALFKAWFVDRLDDLSPAGAVETSVGAVDASGGANDWRRVPLGEALELKRGYDLPHAQRRSGRVPIISSSGPSGFHDVPQVRGPGVVTGRYGTIGKVFLVWDDFWPLNTALYVRDFKGADPLFALYLLRQLDFEKFSDKGAVPGINRNHVHMEPVDIPPEHLQRRFADEVRPWLTMVRSNEVQSGTLTELRDLLLPKLLSGELGIRDAERAVEAVA